MTYKWASMQAGAKRVAIISLVPNKKKKLKKEKTNFSTQYSSTILDPDLIEIPAVSLETELLK